MKCVRTQSMTPNRVLQVFDKKTNHFHKQLIASPDNVYYVSQPNNYWRRQWVGDPICVGPA